MLALLRGGQVWGTDLDALDQAVLQPGVEMREYTSAKGAVSYYLSQKDFCSNASQHSSAQAAVAVALPQLLGETSSETVEKLFRSRLRCLVSQHDGSPGFQGEHSHCLEVLMHDDYFNVRTLVQAGLDIDGGTTDFAVIADDDELYRVQVGSLVGRAAPASRPGSACLRCLLASQLAAHRLANVMLARLSAPVYCCCSTNPAAQTTQNSAAWRASTAGWCTGCGCRPRERMAQWSTPSFPWRCGSW